MMTVKSDDVVGRVKVYEALVKGQPIPKSGVPESFRVLIKEFQALGLDITVLNDEGKFVELKELEENENDNFLPNGEFDKNSKLPIENEPEDTFEEETDFDEEDGDFDEDYMEGDEE